MKIKYLILIITLSFISDSLFSQIVIPLPSPAGSVSTTVGLTEVKIDYFRPQMKGRKIFGTGTEFLVPYGEMWRTGANSGTIVAFDDDISVKNTDIKAGKYLFLTIPGASEWEIILYKDISLGGNLGNFNNAEVAGRFSVKSESLNRTVETLTFNIADISEDSKSANIQLTWENTSVKLPIAVEYDKKVMESIEKNTRVNPGNYAQAAIYYLNTGKDMDQAIAWMDLYLEQNPNHFWHIHNKAKMLAEAGRIKEAKQTAEKSIEVAKASGNDFGYIKLNNNLISSLSNK